MFKASIIEVVFRDGTKGRVAPKALDLLLNADKVFSFKRSSGWVTVGVDPVRARRRGSDYHGPERRVFGSFGLSPLAT